MHYTEREKLPFRENWEHLHEEVGRIVETPFGKEHVVMVRGIWDSLDWFDDHGFSSKALFRHCYDHHPELPLPQAMKWLLQCIFVHRDKTGLPNPRWILAEELPPGYEVFQRPRLG